uniref:WD repeat-containing 3-like protein n=1 Tax=Aegilops tauschii TaxID=37682 RepID=M8C6Y1_AEGTA
MVKAYLRYEPALSFGVVASGHADGSIRLWDTESGACEATLHGHRSAASALRFAPSGAVLASGSKDCDVILWDVVAQAGLFRLRGHRDQVTDLLFLDSGKKLVTCSKDKFIRVWDLDTQHCLQIVGGHHSEIWSMDVDPSEKFLVSGSADPELRVFRIRQSAEEGEDWNKWDALKLFGEIPRQSKERIQTIRFNKDGSLVACQVAGKTADIYRILDETEATRKAKRRLHRKKEKASAKAAAAEGNGSVIDPSPAQDSQNPTVVVTDVFKLLQVLRTSKKICSVAFSPSNPPKGCLATLSLSLNNNVLETYSVDNEKVSKMYSVEIHGHRSDIRSLALNSEDNLLMSTSHNAVKIWNPSTGDCLRTVDSGYGLCSAFVPGNRYGLIGTKTGTLEIIDINSGNSIDVIEAHAGSIRSIVLIPDEDGTVNARGFVTGSADHDVKFWEYQLVQKSDSDTKHLSVTNVRTLKMNDDVLAVSIGPTGKHIAVALLDCTVKVFFLDTLKFCLSLYGHKLPVLCMDISSDGALIVTGSADKNLKIWGMDFGDCHKSIFAHTDSVGKDRTVKYWDADKFELLLTLEGHHAEVWCLAISSRGDFIVTGSHDRSIRRWDRTEEQLFIEEEREKRLEETFEADLDNAVEDRYGQKDDAPDEGSVGVPGKKTKETVTATDAIIDALDTAEEEEKRLNEQKKLQNTGEGTKSKPNVIMQGHSPSEYVLNAVSSVRPNDLEQALLSLPFSDALKLMAYLKEWSLIPLKISLSNLICTHPDLFVTLQVELVCRVCLVLLQTHHNQLTTTPAARSILTELKYILYGRVKDCKDTIGFNLAAMDHIKELLTMRSDAPFRDAKAKLMEIRQEQSKRSDRSDGGEKRKKKKPKPSVQS